MVGNDEGSRNGMIGRWCEVGTRLGIVWADI